MKNIYLTLSVFLLTAASLEAQVVNGNFENIKPNFLPSNWGMNFTQEVSLDTETGESVADEIMYTWCIPSLVYASFEPQSGQYAMEISNAYNVTKNEVITGSATIFSDETQDAPGWNAGIPVAPGANVSMLGFYYKFMPAGDDIAEATIKVLNNQGVEIGVATIDIAGTNDFYEYIYMPINYSGSVSPAFMTITFNMAKEGTTTTFGSRLIVDNVVTNFAALGLDETPNENEFKMYPTVTESELNIIPGNLGEQSVAYKIINTQGKVVKMNTINEASSYVYTMDVSDLSAGVYFLHAESNSGSILKKFIKK
ncbi:T9SS type A sorting domain-containing protein [Flavobacterium sp.]|uniref:T9SS type A sorting domain-containing protein n=1 Tax=Flavobacterium sp. TaxID=239 RepID=UPI002FDD8E3B